MNLDELRDHIENERAAGRTCSCDDGWNPACYHHKIGHFHKPDCCDQPEEDHRAMTAAEYESEFPVLYAATFEAGKNRYRVGARRYWDGVGCHILRLLDGEDDAGLGFDFSGRDLGPLIDGLAAMERALRRI